MGRAVDKGARTRKPCPEQPFGLELEDGVTYVYPDRGFVSVLALVDRSHLPCLRQDIYLEVPLSATAEKAGCMAIRNQQLVT